MDTCDCPNEAEEEFKGLCNHLKVCIVLMGKYPGHVGGSYASYNKKTGKEGRIKLLPEISKEIKNILIIE